MTDTTEKSKLDEAKKQLEDALAEQKRYAIVESNAHDECKAAGKRLSAARRARIEAARAVDVAERQVTALAMK